MHNFEPEPETNTPYGAEPPTETEREVPWSAKDALIATLFFFPAVFVASAVIFAFGSLVTRILFQPEPGYLPIISLGLASFLTSIGMAWFVGIRRRGGAVADFALTDIRIWLDLPLAFLGEIVAFIGLAIYALLLQWGTGWKVPEQDIASEFGANNIGIVLAVIFIVILAPVGEELFFRGFVYPAFRKRWGVGLAMVLSSALFAVFHLHPLLYMPMFIIAMVLAALVEYRRSLAPAIILHALNNLIALLVVFNS